MPAGWKGKEKPTRFVEQHKSSGTRLVGRYGLRLGRSLGLNFKLLKVGAPRSTSWKPQKRVGDRRSHGDSARTGRTYTRGDCKVGRDTHGRETIGFLPHRSFSSHDRPGDDSTTTHRARSRVAGRTARYSCPPRAACWHGLACHCCFLGL